MARIAKTKETTWSRQQEDAREQIAEWLRSGTAQVFQVRGPAGTGKSTLAVEVINSTDALGLCFQGKAASVLRRKGARRVATCHSFRYGAPSVVTKDDGTRQLKWRPREHYERPKLLVVDEVSQIDSQLGRDLLRCGIRLLTVGDGLQLPPIGGQRAFFDEFPVDIELTEVHRQALDSPVLRLATRIREGGPLPPGVDFDINDLLDAEVVICAFRRTRRDLNIQLRRKRFSIRGEAPPQIGERIIATRTSYECGIYNGTVWEVAEAKDRDADTLDLALYDDAEGYVECRAPKAGFNDLDEPHRFPRQLATFDFAHALTCHRSQGSEWDRVAVINETRSPGFARMADDMPIGEFRQRWLYVAVTRAADRVVVVRP